MVTETDDATENGPQVCTLKGIQRAPMTRVAKQVTMYHTVMIFPKIISKSGRARDSKLRLT